MIIVLNMAVRRSSSRVIGVIVMKRNMIGLNWPHPLTSVCKDFKNDGNRRN